MPPLIRLRATNTKLTLLGMNADVSLSQTIEGSFTKCDFAMAADRLSTCLPTKGKEIVFKIKHPEVIELSSIGNTSERVLLSTVDRALVPERPPNTKPQFVDAEFVRAMRDASRMVRRSDDHRYAYHRVLLDAPLGRIGATDGSALFVQGGLSLKGPAVALPALSLWSSPLWSSQSDVRVSVAAKHVTVNCGAWSISVPVDHQARMPNYDELLTRLRQPKARFTLAEDDAKSWMQKLAKTLPSSSMPASVVLCFANPPSFRFDTHSEESQFAQSTSYVSQQTLWVSCAADRLCQALKLGFRTLTTAGEGQPILALDGPRRFVWATNDSSDKQ